MSEEKRKLALRLVEHIDNWIQQNGELNVDAAAKDLAVLIPSTRAEAEAEFVDSSYMDMKPDQFAQLCVALGLEGCHITTVLKSATQCVLHLDEIRRTPYNAGLLSTYWGGDVKWWHDYICHILDNAHEYYVGGTND